MPQAVILFFDLNSVLKEIATEEQIKQIAHHLIKTIQKIRQKNRHACLHVNAHKVHWGFDDANRLIHFLDKDEWRLVSSTIVKNPVARYVEFLGDACVQHCGQDSQALTAAMKFKSGVLSFHQGIWEGSQLEGQLESTTIQVSNFSSAEHVQCHAAILNTPNLPAELLSYDQEVSSPPFNSHGQKVYSNGRDFISPDIDEHNTSKGWKKFDLKGNRLGSYDSNLVWIKD